MNLVPILSQFSPLAFVVRHLLVYLAVVTVLRPMGKRQIGKLGSGQFVVLLLLSETLHGPIVAQDESFLGGLLAAATLLLANWTVGALAACRRTTHDLVTPHPTILVYQGHYLEQNMLQEHLSRAEVDHRLRTHGVFNVGEVDLAILEPDGQLSARRREEAQQPLASGLPAQTQQPLQNNDADPAG